LCILKGANFRTVSVPARQSGDRCGPATLCRHTRRSCCRTIPPCAEWAATASPAEVLGSASRGHWTKCTRGPTAMAIECPLHLWPSLTQPCVRPNWPPRRIFRECPIDGRHYD
jgi:hypothetical protein